MIPITCLYNHFARLLFLGALLFGIKHAEREDPTIADGINFVFVLPNHYMDVIYERLASPLWGDGFVFGGFCRNYLAFCGPRFTIFEMVDGTRSGLNFGGCLG